MESVPFCGRTRIFPTVPHSVSLHVKKSVTRRAVVNPGLASVRLECPKRSTYPEKWNNVHFEAVEAKLLRLSPLCL